MTGDERETAYYAPIVVTPEREAAWSRWKDDYLATCVGGWVEQGGDRQALIEAAAVVVYELGQVDRLPWVPLGRALGLRLEGLLLGQGEYDADQKLDYINALRTTQTSTEHDRVLATAHQLGMTVQQVRNIANGSPTGYEHEVASDARTALYRHYDESGALLYVGIAKDPTQRGEQHRYNSKWFRFVADTQIEWHGSRSLADKAEREAIASELPIFNQTHNRAGRAAAVDYLFGALEASSGEGVTSKRAIA